MFRIRRLLILGLLCPLVLAAVIVAVAGEMLSRPALHAMAQPPSQLEAQPFLLHPSSSMAVAGWLVRGQADAGVVLLLHGVRSDRTQMISRAEFLHRLGYSVVLIDLPGHGESTAPRITFGANESAGVRATLDYIATQFPGERVAIIGVSLGAASFVLSRFKPEPTAVVLESMFPTIEEAVRDRLRLHLGKAGPMLAPLLLWQLPLRAGVSPEQLRPVAILPTLHAPVLIASGCLDRHTTYEETERLFEVANQPKELWLVPGAAHVDLHQFAPQQYETRISAFLAQYLRHTSALPNTEQPPQNQGTSACVMS